MAIFARVKSAARTFGQRLFGKASSEQANHLRKEAEVAKAREDRARREAAEAAKTARDLSSARGRAGAATRAGEEAVERQRRQIMEAARREREAREEANRARLEAEALRRKAESIEREAAHQESTRNKAREAYLRTRKNIEPGEWDDTFQGPRPNRPKIDRNRKQLGLGTLPSEKRFMLLGEPLSRFASSNVDTIQYDISRSELYIKYIKSQRWYCYHGVSLALARQAYQASSRGVFVWDRLRVRGTRKGIRISTTRDRAPPDYLPLVGSAAELAINGGGL